MGYTPLHCENSKGLPTKWVCNIFTKEFSRLSWCIQQDCRLGGLHLSVSHELSVPDPFLTSLTLSRRGPLLSAEKVEQFRTTTFFTTWNTRSMAHERFQYCQDLGYDVLLSLQSRNSGGLQRNSRTGRAVGHSELPTRIITTICSTTRGTKHQVWESLLLSDRTMSKCLTHGSAFL